MSDTPTETVATEESPAAVDTVREGLLERLQAELGDAIVGSEIAGGDIWVRVERSAWHDALRACRDRLDMQYFCFLSAIDWMPAPDLSGEKVFEPAEGAVVTDDIDDDEDEVADEELDDAGADDTAASGERRTGVAGGDTRFQVIARLYDVVSKVGITLKADLDDDDPEVTSVVDVYAGADWHERETWEMYGIQFLGHPGLRHIYLPGEFEGYPLRKDFPLLAREVKPWPGLVDVEPLPGEPAGGDAEAEGA